MAELKHSEATVLAAGTGVMLFPVRTEEEFDYLLRLESAVYDAAGVSRFPVHPQSAVADRWLFGSPEGMFRYAHLILGENGAIGFASAYHIYPGERKFSLQLLPGYAHLYAPALRLMEPLLHGENREMAVHINTRDRDFARAARRCGYHRPWKQSRWQGAIDLRERTAVPVAWETETIAQLGPADFAERARYSALPTGHEVSAAQYEAMYNSVYYRKAARDYVIRADGRFAGFLTWWVNGSSKAASLEAVATVPEFRRRGIMRRAVADGLNRLQEQGVQYAYVSTSYGNPARGLYEGAGFRQVGKAYLYRKKK